MVESYVLGLLTAQERFEFEKFCEAYPELKEARDAFELAVEKQAMENATILPADITSLMDAVAYEGSVA